MNQTHARRRGPGERVGAEPKNWKIRFGPNNADKLIAAVQPLMTTVQPLMVTSA